jgi:hypothetical protein
MIHAGYAVIFIKRSELYLLSAGSRHNKNMAQFLLICKYY